MPSVKTTDAIVAGFNHDQIRDTIVQKQLEPENWEILKEKDIHGVSWKSRMAQLFWSTSKDYEVNFIEDSKVESLHYITNWYTDHELEIGDSVARYYGIDEEDFLEPDEVQEVGRQLNEEEIPAAYSNQETWLDDELQFEEENGQLKVPLVAQLEIDQDRIPKKNQLGRFPHVDYINQKKAHNPENGLESYNLYRGPWMQLEDEEIAGKVSRYVKPGDSYHLESTYFDSAFFNSEIDGFPVFEVNAAGHPVPDWDSIESVYMDLFREDPNPLD